MLACSGSAPPLAGRLTWLEETDDGMHVRTARASTPASVRSIEVEGSAFPAPADPRGESVLVLGVVDDERGHQEQLWSVPPDGPPIAMGPPSPFTRNPAWSPDGAWLVVESARASFRDLYKVTRDGAAIRLTNDKNGNFEPDVARDGSIAFVSSRDGNAEIYVMGPDGRNPLRLTDHPGNDTNPVWSPDGQTVAWLAWRGESVSTHVLLRGESKGRPLRGDAHTDRAIAWSPTGDRLAITTSVGPKDLAVDLVRRDGTLIARLDGPGPDEHPTWSPDGAHLVFTSSRNGTPDLFLASADGTAIRPLVAGPAPEWLPRWGP